MWPCSSGSLLWPAGVADVLNVLFDPILPVFAILFVGYIAGRLGKMTDEEARILNRFAMTVLLPVFVFRAVAFAPITDFNIAALGLYASAQAVLYAVGFVIAHKVFRLGVSESILLGFCGVFANNAYYVLPIAKLLYGETATLPVASIVIMDAVLAFGGTMVALEARKGRDAGAGLALVAKRIAQLPLIWALTLGLLFSAGAIAIPAPINTFTSFVGNAASPIALFAMGVILAATPIKPEPVAIVISGLKAVIFPATIAALLYTLLPPSDTLSLFVLASAGPAGVMAFSLALLYSVRTDAIMQVTVWTSVLTLISLAFLA